MDSSQRIRSSSIPRTRSPPEPRFEPMPRKPEVRNESKADPVSVVDGDDLCCWLHGRSEIRKAKHTVSARIQGTATGVLQRERWLENCSARRSRTPRQVVGDLRRLTTQCAGRRTDNLKPGPEGGRGQTPPGPRNDSLQPVSGVPDHLYLTGHRQ